MNEIIEINEIKNMIYEINGVEVMLDSDLALLYQIETKRINEAVNRNKEKFPERFTWILDNDELKNLRSQFATANISSKSRSNPRVFTEQGIYMLGTILKSFVATNVSIAIMDTFVNMRHYINYNKNILPNRIMLLEDKVNENTKDIRKLFDLFEPKEIEKNYLFFQNEFFKSHYVLMKIFDIAKKEIIIIDNYAGKELLKELSDIKLDIKIISNNINEELKKKYEKEYNNVTFIYNNSFHDRFIIIDRIILYTCGSSFKDLGKKCFSINELSDKEYINKIIHVLNI